MINKRRDRTAMVAMILVVALIATGLTTGCGKKTETAVSGGPTALGNLAAARSTMSTMAPDAKLLLVQTASAVTPTATPSWVFLFGSPSTGKTYVAYLAGGKTMTAEEYGPAGLEDSEWAKVPGIEDWKTDSDEAYDKALAVSGATAAPSSYMMGLVTYKSEADTSPIEPFVWRVWFEPGASRATTSAIDVDAKTGVATVTSP